MRDLHGRPTRLKDRDARYVQEYNERTERSNETTEYHGKGQGDHDRTENVPDFLLAVAIDDETEDGCHNRVDNLP